MSLKSTMTLFVASFALAACQNGFWGGQSAPPPAPKQHVSQQAKPRSAPAAASPDILLNAWADPETTAAMDENDRRKNQQAEKRAYTSPIGQQITWNNLGSGNSGTIVAVRDNYDQNGAYCREFQQTVTIGGEQQQGSGRACQKPDGSWKIVP